MIIEGPPVKRILGPGKKTRVSRILCSFLRSKKIALLEDPLYEILVNGILWQNL